VLLEKWKKETKKNSKCNAGETKLEAQREKKKSNAKDKLQEEKKLYVKLGPGK